jgi:hypothetical protein
MLPRLKSKRGSSSPCAGRRKNRDGSKNRRTPLRMTPRPPVHRRRFFLTPTGTCGNPTPRVKIFLVSSDCAHTQSASSRKLAAVGFAFRRGMPCPANMLGYLCAIHAATWARRCHSERSLPVFLFHPARSLRRMRADAAEESLSDLRIAKSYIQERFADCLVPVPPPADFQPSA